MASRVLPTTAGKCDLPFLDPKGHVVFFDVQSAEPGAFTIPGVVDLETYKPGDLVETSWIYFKGNPQAGPQPGHPLERPFNDTVKFSVDLVRDNDTSTVLREIMPPSNSSAFWKGGAPFGRPGDQAMYIPLLDGSCEYYVIGEMIYRWTAPDDLEDDTVYRLKLNTDVPATTHISGKLQVSHAGTSSAPSVRLQHAGVAGTTAGGVVGICSIVVLSLLCAFWLAARLRRRSGQISLP